MAIDVEVEIRIERPRAQVAAYMFDPRNDAAWTTGVVECRPLSDGPLRPGSRVERIVKFLGRRFGYTYEVTDAGDDFVEMRVEKPFPMLVRYALEDAPGGTRAKIRARGEPGGFFKVAAPFMKGMVRKNIGADLALLKKNLET